MKAVVLPLVLLLAFAASARGDDKVELPVPVRTTAPEFPYAMSKARLSGFVLVDCLVDVHGDVQDMKVEKTSNPEFVQPAMAALKKWKFKPAERDGSRVAMRVSIPIRFNFTD
jgi:protein TonB